MNDTFGSKPNQMVDDLRSIVDRMNRDKSYGIAVTAQAALLAVSEVEDKIDKLYSGADELDWDWEPDA